MPLVINMADTVPWTWYDSFTIAAGAAGLTEYQLFSVPMNQGGKTKMDTNMTLVQQLAPPQFFNCLNIGFYIQSDMVKADVDAIMKNYYYEFWVTQKIYSEGPLWRQPSGAGITGVSTATSQQVWTNGVPNPFAKASLSLPPGLQLNDPSNNSAFVTNGVTNGISILQGQTFYVKLYTNSAPTAAAAPAPGIKIYCTLDGLLSRQVQ